MFNLRQKRRLLWGGFFCFFLMFSLTRCFCGLAYTPCRDVNDCLGGQACVGGGCVEQVACSEKVICTDNRDCGKCMDAGKPNCVDGACQAP
ncbi:MAG: hypothetical protein H6728_14995 [Myxococcales bacterium]|nr:hypothetical protein [Myxococcales bacterium]